MWTYMYIDGDTLTQ